MAPSPTPRADLSSLVASKERFYFALSVAVGIAVYALVGWLLWNSAEARPIIIMYGLLGILASLAMHGFLLGHIRGNGVRVSARQFSNLNAVVAEHSRIFEMEPPDVFVLQSGGMLNAFATRFLGRNFVVLYSDVLAMAEKTGGEAAVSFVVGHELAHHKRGHLKWRWLVLPARIVPFLGSAYSRACEYTCDRFGAVLAQEGAVSGLLALAAGRDLYQQVEPRLFANQVESEAGFWTTVSEIFASHPHLTKRVGALLQAGHAVPSYSPIAAGVMPTRVSTPSARVRI